MQKREVGKITGLTLRESEGELDIVFTVTDAKFKKKILRDLTLAGMIEVSGDKILFVSDEEPENA